MDGFRLYGASQHQKTLHWLLKGSYERFTRKLFPQTLKPGMRVLDIGAHIGYYTLLAARGVGPTGKVYAFEADPRNRRFLEHNIALNGMGDVVTVVGKAASDAAGVLPFFASDDSLTSSLWIEGKATTSIDVECVAVDDAVDASEEIHVIKLDIEGGELHALDGMRQTIATARDLVLFVECNPKMLAAVGSSSSELLARLDQLGLHVRAIDEKHRCLRPVDDLFEADVRRANSYVNLYCTKGIQVEAGVEA